MSDGAFDHSGSSFDDVLHEEGLLEEAEASAVRRVIAWQLGEMMRAQGVTRDPMAERRGRAGPRSTGSSTQRVATSNSRR